MHTQSQTKCPSQSAQIYDRPHTPSGRLFSPPPLSLHRASWYAQVSTLYPVWPHILATLSFVSRVVTRPTHYSSHRNTLVYLFKRPAVMPLTSFTSSRLANDLTSTGDGQHPALFHFPCAQDSVTRGSQQTAADAHRKSAHDYLHRYRITLNILLPSLTSFSLSPSAIIVFSTWKNEHLVLLVVISLEAVIRLRLSHSELPLAL